MKRKTASTKTTTHSLVILFAALGIIFIIYCFIPSKNREGSGYNQKDINVPEILLAVIQDKHNPPDDVTINLFKNILNNISLHYPSISQKEISRVLIAGRDLAFQNGYQRSVLAFSTEFKAYSAKMRDNKLPLQTNMALFIKQVTGL